MPPDEPGQPGAVTPSNPSVPVTAGTIQTPTQPAVNPAPADPSGEPDLEKLEGNTRAYIQNLRKENAKYRTAAKTATDKLESVKTAMGVRGDETPEVQAARLNAERETVAFENAVLTNAIEHGVNREGMKYFHYLLADAAAGLNVGEELSAEAIAEIAKEAKAKSVKPAATTTVTQLNPNGGASAAPSPVGNAEAMTVEKFSTLGFNEKCKLYESNPAQYEQLMAQATQKRLIK